jgi:hypothetical protein
MTQTLRHWMGLMTEIRIGGEVDSGHLDDLESNHNFTPKQMTLPLPNVTAEPTLPPKMEMAGRLGAYYVARKKDDGESYYKRAGDEYMYYLFDSGKPVAYVSTIHPKTEFGDAYRGRLSSDPKLQGEGLRVVSIFLDPSIRGQRTSVALYEWLLHNVCDYILPDDLQTQGGVYIWKQLVSDPRFEVMIFNHEKYEFYRARPGATWRNVYRSENLRPFVTLAGKADGLIDS